VRGGCVYLYSKLGLAETGGGCTAGSGRGQAGFDKRDTTPGYGLRATGYGLRATGYGLLSNTILPNFASYGATSQSSTSEFTSSHIYITCTFPPPNSAQEG
jgi:hypothetical protein